MTGLAGEIRSGRDFVSDDTKAGDYGCEFAFNECLSVQYNTRYSVRELYD